MDIQLPDDVLHLLCEELAFQEQFDTLFNCACASRSFAIPALTNLYRSHHLAPVRGGGEDETVTLATRQLMVQKWSILWRSIISSSLDATLFPYCRYIKTLDLRDLQHLFEDYLFKNKILKQFFSEPLARFHINIDVRPKPSKGTRLDYSAIIDAIGEVVTQHTPMLECISGQLLSHALVRWAPRLPRLQTLELYNGSPLEDELVHASIFEHCPHFNSLSIYTWMAEERDHKLAHFLGTMKPQSLKMLETIRDIGVGAETFLALNAHGESLKDLRLSVSDDSLPHLSLLGGCTSLESLRIEDADGRTNLEKTQNDIFLETIAWLKKCANLKSLSFTKLQSASALVTPLLFENSIQLRRLEIDGANAYIPKDCQVFHQALTNQRATLRVLSLTGDTEGMFRDDVDILVDSLKQLTGLTTLKLLLVQEIFHDEHLISIIESLPLLEDLYLTGMEMKDGILSSLAHLRALKSVAFSGISKFTTDGLLEYVSLLTPGNQGIRVMIDMVSDILAHYTEAFHTRRQRHSNLLLYLRTNVRARQADPDTILSDEEVNLVRDALWEKVGGTIEYTPWRDPNVSEFEGDSD